MNRLLAFLIAFCIVLPAVAADKESPFLIEKRDFRKQYRTIALAPVDADAIFGMPESAARMIEEEVTRHLQKRGYTVIPTSVLKGIRETMESQVGGIEDPQTGQVNLAKLQAVRAHAFRELWFQRDFDAIATIRVIVSKAQFAKDRAEWDGVKQKVENKGRNRGYAGTIVASSVSFAIYDQTDKLIYWNYGGLEVLQMRNEAQLLPIPAESYFSDEKRIRKAAKVAISPI
jgi:hypothetical protein